jgi:hypothetical protein
VQRNSIATWIGLVLCFGFSSLCYAAEQGADADALAKAVANPLAALISVPIQLNWDTGLAANGPGEKYLLNVQPVIPIGLNDKWNP